MQCKCYNDCNIKCKIRRKIRRKNKNSAKVGGHTWGQSPPCGAQGRFWPPSRPPNHFPTNCQISKFCSILIANAILFVCVVMCVRHLYTLLIYFDLFYKIIVYYVFYIFLRNQLEHISKPFENTTFQ